MPLYAVVTPNGTLNLGCVQGVTFRTVASVTTTDLTSAVVVFRTVGGSGINWSTTTGEISLVGGIPSTVTLVVSATATAALPVGQYPYLFTAQLPSGGDNLELASGLIQVANS